MFTLILGLACFWFVIREISYQKTKSDLALEEREARKEKSNELAEENLRVQRELLTFYKSKVSQGNVHVPQNDSSTEEKGYRYVSNNSKKIVRSDRRPAH